VRHPLDFTYSTGIHLSDIRYLDLVYASEENPYYRPFHETDFKPYLVDTGDVVVYSVGRIIHDGFPGLGYRLTENRFPLYLKVENEFCCEITDGHLHVTR